MYRPKKVKATKYDMNDFFYIYIFTSTQLNKLTRISQMRISISQCSLSLSLFFSQINFNISNFCCCRVAVKKLQQDHVLARAVRSHRNTAQLRTQRKMVAKLLIIRHYMKLPGRLMALITTNYAHNSAYTKFK